MRLLATGGRNTPARKARRVMMAICVRWLCRGRDGEVSVFVSDSLCLSVEITCCSSSKGARGV